MVVRAPDGRPPYGHAMSAFGYNVYHLPKEVTTKDEMAAALRDWMHPGTDTTEGLRPWPAGTAEGEIVRGPPGGLSYTIDTGNKFTQLTWNALRAAKRPAFGFKVSPETGVTVVLLPDGRVIEAAAVWSN